MTSLPKETRSSCYGGVKRVQGHSSDGTHLVNRNGCRPVIRKYIQDSTPIQPYPTDHISQLQREYCVPHRFFPVISTLLGSRFLAASPELCIALSALAICVT